MRFQWKGGLHCWQNALGVRMLSFPAPPQVAGRESRARGVVLPLDSLPLAVLGRE